jgi:hypothetical protein
MRAFGRAFAVLHESGRQGPVAVARFDGAPAQHHLALPDGQRTDHHARVLVVDAAAGGAHMAQAVVARRNDLFDLAAAVSTELHVSSVDERVVGQAEILGSVHVKS